MFRVIFYAIAYILLIRLTISIHIYESQDFKTEGLLKEQFYTKGKYKDAYFMSLLKSEYIL